MRDERGKQDVEQRIAGVDDSYRLVRRTLHAPYLGLGIGSGNAEPDEVASLRAAFQQALAAEGLSADDVKATVWPVGRSAAAFDILLYVGGGLFAIAAGIKQTDDAVAVLRKWWRAIKQTRDKLGGGLLTVEALKLACIDDLAERYGQRAAPELDRIVVGAGAAQYQDGTWWPTSPVYVTIPDRGNDCTHVYVVGLDGEIVHHAVLPYFRTDESEPFRLGPVSDAGAAGELQAMPRPDQDWDADGP